MCSKNAPCRLVSHCNTSLFDAMEMQFPFASVCLALSHWVFGSVCFPFTKLMGSFGRGSYVTCYWCDYWVHDPYIIDRIGKPLCDLCFDWHMGWGRFQSLAAQYGEEHWCGGPYEPCETTRNISLLQRLRPLGEPDQSQVLLNDLALDVNICVLITSFLCEWHEP